MNFTREPIIETIITPKDGYKLVVRSSKSSGGEEYAVDAVEVVSFGNALFFRSQERPRPFLVPVTDFEIVEAKETRVVLKNASFERSIKIGGGKEGSMKASKEKEEEPEQVEQRLEKKRERRRHRRRRGGVQTEEETPQPPAQETAAEGGGAEDETPVSSSPVSRLIPPPPGLISDKIAKTREEAPQAAEGDVLPEPVAEEDVLPKPVAEEEKEEKPKRGRRRKRADAKADQPTADAPQSEKAESEEPKLDQPTSKAPQGEEPKNKSDEEETPKAKEPPPQEPPAQDEGKDVNRISIEAQETVTSTSFSSLEPSDGELFGKFW